MLKGYRTDAVDHILREAAKVGGQDGAKVMRGAAPIGTSEREGQYYRRQGLGHGTFRKSVRAAAIRGRGSAIKGLQAKTVGVVMRYAFRGRWWRGTARIRRRGRGRGG